MSSCSRHRPWLSDNEPGPGSGCATPQQRRSRIQASPRDLHRDLLNMDNRRLKGGKMSFRDDPRSLWEPMLDATSPADLASDLSELGSSEWPARNPCDKDLQRAEGCGRIVVGGLEKGTRIMDVFQRSPIHILFPRIGGGALEEAVVVNTA